MRSRLVWAAGGFVLVALVVYRFLTRARAAALTAEPLAAELVSGDPTGDTDERVEALRRKLDETREAPVEMREAPAEPPLEERRRAVHDAGHRASEAMRHAHERQPDQPTEKA